MADDRAISGLLSQLDGIANAPLTPNERELRASTVLQGLGYSVVEISAAIQNGSLPWNQGKAVAFGVPIETWLNAVKVVRLAECASLAELISRLHQAEVAVAMLATGYTPSLDSSGQIVWTSTRAPAK